MIIRKAQEKDWEIIKTLNNEVFIHDQEFDKDLNLSWPFSEEGTKYYKNLVSDKDIPCFIAEDKNEALGYIALGLKDIPYRKGKYLEIENMRVLPKYRSQGIGRLLVLHIKKWAKRSKITKIYVSAYHKNTKAIKFYKREGFKQIDVGLELPI